MERYTQHNTHLGLKIVTCDDKERCSQGSSAGKAILMMISFALLLLIIISIMVPKIYVMIASKIYGDKVLEAKLLEDIPASKSEAAKDRYNRRKLGFRIPSDSINHTYTQPPSVMSSIMVQTGKDEKPVNINKSEWDDGAAAVDKLMVGDEEEESK